MALPEDIETQLAAMDERLRRLQEELEAQDEFAQPEEPAAPSPEPKAEPEPAPAPEPRPVTAARAEAGDEAARIAREAHSLVDRLADEIGDLMAVRDRLQASGRILMGDLQATVEQVQAAMVAAAALASPAVPVTVIIEPAGDLAHMGSLARSIGALTGVREVSVRRYEPRRAVLDVHAPSASALAVAIDEQLSGQLALTEARADTVWLRALR